MNSVSKYKLKPVLLIALLTFSVYGYSQAPNPTKIQQATALLGQFTAAASAAAPKLQSLTLPNPIAYPFVINNPKAMPPDLAKVPILDASGKTTTTADQILGTNTGCGNPQVTQQRSMAVNQILGPKAAKDYQEARHVMCRLVGAAAQIKYRSDLYSQAETQGLYLWQFNRSEKKEFKEGIFHKTRTLALSGGLLWNPNYAANEASSQPVSMQLYFKYSDTTPIDLRNIKSSIAQMNQGGDSHRALCFMIDGTFYIDLKTKQPEDKIQPQICTYVSSTTDTTVNMDVFAKYEFEGDHTYDLGTVPVPAPFGYLNDLSNYKASLKQNLQNEIRNQISSMLGTDGQLLMTLTSK